MRHLKTWALIAILAPMMAAAQDTRSFSLGEATPETQETAPMTPQRLGQILLALDPEAKTNGTNLWQFGVAGVTVLVVYDLDADRMRAIAPVRPVEGITPEEMARMMQANFDSALDARYAIAKGMLWAAFIHPLAALQGEQLVMAIGQVVNLHQSYGTLYSSGLLQFNGGDSLVQQRKLIDDLLAKAGKNI